MLINPSNIGWIEKLVKEVGFEVNFNFDNHHTLYQGVYQSGYLYGFTKSVDVFFKLDISKFTHQEISKIYLFSCLVSVYKINQKGANFEHFLLVINQFYQEIIPKNQFLKKFLPNEKSTIVLENYIENRVKINENILTKFFSSVFTNSFLFLDVLAFKNYISSENYNKNYLLKLEENSINLVLVTLLLKKNKSSFDEIILKTFENSLKYNKLEDNSLKNIDDFNFNVFTNTLEKYFIIDLIIFTLWQENKNQENEDLIFSIAEKLNLEIDYVIKNRDFINYFIKENQSQIPYFNNKNVFENLYSNTSSIVVRLITRNKSRLLKELSQSKELVQLLAKASIKNLDKEEKRKVKKQILDICKVVPSLTIFLLPGGGLLLPILIKFIPQLLPSAFNENLE